jgi:hypothetical protein
MIPQNPSSLSQDTKNRIVTSVTDVYAGNQIIGSLGLIGGFQLGASAVVAKSTGDIQAIPDSGGAPGTYRIIFPYANSQIQSINWFEVAGFTPRNPTSVETAAALVTGYNYDASLKQWYITVQIVSNTSWAVLSSPPTGFVVGVRVAVTLLPSANQL